MPVDWEALVLPAGSSDALTLAVLVLAGLVVARAGVLAGLRLAGRLPGRVGRVAAWLVAVVRPGAARRLFAVALGLGAAAVVPVVDLAGTAAQAVEPVTDAGRAEVATAGRAHPSAPQPAVAPPAITVVVAGDTLWDIARRHLPAGATDADVARAWPRWYAVNRAVIGPDPALIRPGMRLRLPDRRSTGTSTSTHDRPSATRTDAGAVARSLDPDRR